MGLRFRRSGSVVPGIRLNLGLKSGSVSFGTRGLHYTVGTSGSRITAGLPGTGLFWTQKLKSPFGTALPQQATQNPLPSAATAQAPQGQQTRTVAPPLGAGARSPVPRPQTLSPFLGAQPSQLSQPQGISLPTPSSGQNSTTQKPMHLSGYPVSATSTHLVIPAWLVWAVVAVIVIAGLCFLSAIVGNLVR
jgi:Protein of unknown function (DUF4236)